MVDNKTYNSYQFDDDFSWKVELLDLSKTQDGIIKRDASFGHFELPLNRSLKQSLDFSLWKPKNPLVIATRQEVRNISTGALIDPYDL